MPTTETGKIQLEIPCFIFENYEGRTLEEVIKNSVIGLDFTEVKRYIHAIICTLEHLHEKEFFINFLSPKNIWINDKGESFLINLDVIFKIKGEQITGSMVKRFHPFSCSHKPSVTADIYSAGILLYHMLCPQVREEELSENSRLYRDLKPIFDYRRDVPKYFEDAIFKSIDMVTRARYTNISEFKKDLRI
jgi:serine/threonine protein kinase